MKTKVTIPFLMCLFGTCFLSCGSSEPNTAKEPSNEVAKEAVESSPDSLGVSFLAALQENDIEKFLACWMQANHLEEVPVDWENSIFTKESMLAYLEERDGVIKATFPVLRRAIISQCGALDSLELHEVVTNGLSNGPGYQKAGSIDIALSAPSGRTLRYRIDDGLLHEGLWLFSDKPSSSFTLSSSEGESAEHSLSEFATEEELEEFRRLGVS